MHKKSRRLWQRITLGLLLSSYLYSACPVWAADPTFTAGTGTDSTAAGVGVTASGTKSFAAGYKSKATGENSIAIGVDTSTSATSTNASANGKYSISIGTNSRAGNTDGTGSYTTAIGYGAVASGENATTVGVNSTASQKNASAFGYNVRATGEYATAVGASSTATQNYAASFGYYDRATSQYATAVGYYNYASAVDTTAVGYRNTASRNDASAMGNQNWAYGVKSSSLGSHNVTGSSDVSGFGENASAVGNTNTAVGYDSNAFGSHNQAGLIEYEHRLMLGASPMPIYPSTDYSYFTSIADCASAMGYANGAYGEHSSAFGAENTTGTARIGYLYSSGDFNGAHASAMGDSNTAYGNYSSAIGYSNQTGLEGSLSSNYASAMGAENKSFGEYSSAIGAYNTVGYEEYDNYYGSYASAMGYGNTAYGENSTAVGYANTAVGSNSSAVGSGNHAGGYNSSVFGSNSSTYGAYSVAVGYDNISAVEGASTFGVSNRAGFYRYEDGTEYIGGNYASAMGYDNDAFSYSSVAVGYGNIVGDEVDPDSANGGSAIGSNNRVYSPSATAVGISNTVGNTENPELARYASAIGGYNEAYGEESSGIGQENEAYGMTSSAVGAYNRAHGRLSVAMGTSSVAYTDHSVALGINAQAGVKDSTEATSALAIGLGEAEYDEDGYFGYDDEWHPIITGGAFATANKAIAIGFNTSSSAESAIAIGTNASAELKDSVALGSESVTGTEIPELGTYTYMGKTLTFAGSEPMSVVSVGAEGKERRITNVAAGRISSTSTDAINGSQLYALAGVINSRINDVISGMPNVEAGENITVDVTETPIGGEPGSGTEIADAEEPAEITQKTYTVSGEGGSGGWNTSMKLKAGESNLVLTSTEDEEAQTKEYTLGLNKDLQLNSVNIGGAVQINNNGIDMGGTKITNVANGTAASDGVNLGQVTKLVEDSKTTLQGVETKLNGSMLNVSVTTKEGIKQNTKSGSVDLSNLTTKQGDANAEAIEGLRGSMANQGQEMARLNRNINRVGAGAAALAALHPLDFDPDDKLTFAAGVGHYHGENAGAVGAFYRPDEKIMLSVGGTLTNHENMINAGVSFSLDRVPRVTNSKAAMAREILELKQELAQVKELLYKLADPNYKPVTAAPVVDRFRVDRVHGEDDERHKVERIRLNADEDYNRDVYGNANPQPVTSRGPQYPEKAK